MVRKVLVFALFMFAATGLVLAAAGALDGKTFEVSNGEKGKPATAEKDTLTFADGKFHSGGCDKYGFTATDYSTAKSGDTFSFMVMTKSEKEGSIHWMGTVKGDAIDGTYVWSKPGQKDIEYWFKGTIKK